MPWPLICSFLAYACGAGLVVAGVHLLLGAGWALLAGAIPCLLLAIVIARGLN